MRPQKLPNREGLPALTGLRFLAAFYVVVSHGLPWIRQHFRPPERLLPLLENGVLAVALFFLLSGFLLSYTYERHLKSPREFAIFWEGRFARIYPVYLLSLLLALPFQFRLALPVKLAVLTMTQAWNPLHQDWAGAWNYPAWSLSVEAFFYALFPFVQKVLSRTNNIALLIFTAAMALACVLVHTPVQGIGGRTAFFYGSNYVTLPLLRLPEFLLGMSLGNCFLRNGQFFRSSFYTYFAAATALVLISSPIGDWVSLVIVPFAVLIYSLASASNIVAAFLSSRLMLLLGGASYCVYLLQAPFRDWVRVLSEHALGQNAKLVTLLTPLLLVVFSIAVFKWFEEPLRRAIKGRLVPVSDRNC